MSYNMYLKGEIEGPSGHAPSAAWQSVEGELERPEDIWVSGDPLSPGGEIFDRLRQRLQIPEGPVGLRVRFVVDRPLQQGDDIFRHVNAVLSRIPDLGAILFLHAETMTGPEQGVYLAFENRLPALVTQIHFRPDQEKHPDTTRLAEVPDELHLNVLLHDTSLGFVEALGGTLLDRILERLGDDSGSKLRGRVQELSIARSDVQPDGVSVGVERAGQQTGAGGGFSATDEENRSGRLEAAGLLGQQAGDQQDGDHDPH